MLSVLALMLVSIMACGGTTPDPTPAPTWTLEERLSSMIPADRVAWDTCLDDFPSNDVLRFQAALDRIATYAGDDFTRGGMLSYSYPGLIHNAVMGYHDGSFSADETGEILARRCFMWAADDDHYPGAGNNLD